MNSFITIIILSFFFQEQMFLPFGSRDRCDVTAIRLTSIGQYGLIRKARPNIPKHYHTGIDLKRPNNNYISEPIFPITEGKVISKRTDGAYANIIIAHEIKGIKFWTLYEHVSEIRIMVGEFVNAKTQIASYMNKDELNKFGWQFDHIHFEVLKVKPRAIKPSKGHEERHFDSYSLICYTLADLGKYYFNPIEFLNRNINTN